MKKQIEKFTKEWFAEQGRIGGEKTKSLYGLKHYSKMSQAKVDKSKKLEKSPVK